MPSRKQRRRREKLKRHEYEYVVETDEGEVPLEELEDERGRRKDSRAADATGAVPLDRRGRPLQKPSLERVLKRAAIFGPVLLAFVYITSGDTLSLAGILLNTALLLAFFIPFSYAVDVMVYRLMTRRQRR